MLRLKPRRYHCSCSLVGKRRNPLPAGKFFFQLNT